MKKKEIKTEQQMSQQFENGWGVRVGNHVVGSGMRLFQLTILKDGVPQFNNERWGWLTEADVERLSAIVESWAPDQTFPEWEDEEE